ncbi:hypothetical protein BHC53_07595 [Snodgrassella alvi]|nr:hypothetical protein BHC53_07595 [Snodgrassella alvi]
MAGTDTDCGLIQHIGGFRKLLTNRLKAEMVTQLIIESVIYQGDTMPNKPLSVKDFFNPDEPATKQKPVRHPIF